MADQTYSGIQRVIFNFRERAISDDFARLQQLFGFTIADLFRRLHCSTALEEEAGGKTTPVSATTSPLRAIVFEGVRFRPEIGTVNAFVEAGSLLAVFPASSPHPNDSAARLVHDDGTSSVLDPTFVLTAGAGSTRIDVVECQPSEVVTEADSRDRFDPSTGLFSATLVNKIAKGRMSYRIRVGTAGAGFPGTASGWLPIAVCSVPSSATTWDDVTVWDVRPLLADLARGPHLTFAPFPRTTRRHVVAVEPSSAAGEWRAKGIVDLELSGWAAGGDLSPSIVGGLGYLRLDALDAALTVQEPSFSVTADRPWYLYLAQPFGLPRWAKYTSSGAGGERRPASPRGIPIFSQIAPGGVSGVASASLALPTNTGLGSTTANAIVATAGMFAGSFFAGSTTGDRTESFHAIPIAPTSGNNTASPVYTVTAGVHFPPCVTAIRVQFQTTITLGAGTVTAFDRSVLLRNAAGTEVYGSGRRFDTGASPAAGSFVDYWEAWFDLPPNLPSGAAVSFTLAMSYANAAGSAYSAQTVDVKGWKLG